MRVDSVEGLRKGDDILVEVESGDRVWYNLYTTFDGKNSFESVKIYSTKPLQSMTNKEAHNAKPK